MSKVLLRIKGRGNESSIYSTSAIKFALVSRPEGGIRKQATPFYSCRDHINDTLQACVHKQDESGKYSPDVDLTKLRLLIGKDCKNKEERYAFKEKLFSAKRLLNFYEKVAVWEKPSVITTVRLEDSNTKNAWLLTGPEEWLRYSHLTSMVTLILRIMSKYGPIEFNNINSVEKWFEDLMASFKGNNNSGVSTIDWDLSNYLPPSYQKFYMLMKYHRELFVDPMEEAYPKGVSIHSSGGIFSLCSFNSGNSALNQRMKDTWKKYEKERQERVKLKMESQYKMEKGAPSL